MLDEIPSDAVMCLINAIYYNASWQYRFEKSKTEERPFYLADGTTVHKETMYCDGAKIAYYKDNDLQMFDIPYGNGLYFMTILMPHEAAGINTFASNLTSSDLNSYLDKSNTTTLRLFLPKFKAKYKKTLNEVLSDLGMGIAFSEQADLSGLFEESLSVAISKVLHQALIEVDEDGTEAAAATITEVFTTSAPDEPPVVTSIDRPFVFFIREKTSNTILFAGKLMEP
jgi:serpin B